MRTLIISLVLLPVFVNAQQDYWALLQTNCADYAAARELRQALVDDGHLVSLIYQPQWMVARLQASPATVKEQHPQVLAVGQGPGGSHGMDAPSTLSHFFEKMAAGGFGPQARSKTGETEPAQFPDAACGHLEPLAKTRMDEYPLDNDANSEYLRGLITTSVFFIESDGSEDPNYYSWTQAALEEEKLDILMALHTWAYTAYLFDADATFVPVWYDSRPEINQGLEPNLHLGSFEFYPFELNKMTGAVLNKLGYQSSWTGAQGNNFSHRQRQTYASDHAFVIGVHYSHQSKGYIRANAMIGGPITYLSPEYDYRVYGHEIGHIFHALDEYPNTQNCEFSTFGFNGAANGNNIANFCPEKQPCVMNDNAVLGEGDEIQFAVCSYSAIHFGWGEQTLPPAPRILTEVNEPIDFPFFLLEAEFPARRDRLQGYVKIWQVKNGRDSLIISEELGEVAGTKSWINAKALLPGTYKCVFYHGQRYAHALVPSEPLVFEVDYSPVFPFRDTCLYFCRVPGPVSFPQGNLRWYGDRGLQKLVHEGGEFIPEFNTDSTLYLVQYEEQRPVDIARVHFLFGYTASVAVQSRIEAEGRIAVSLYSFLPIQNVRTIQWYKDGEPLPGAHDWSIYAEEPGVYNATLDNGCLIESDTLRLVFPPQVTKNALCDQDGYQLIARGTDIRWYDERRTLVSTADTFTVTRVDRYYLYFVTQTIDGVESPDFEVLLPPMNEEERIDLLNTNGYLRVKAPSPIIDWWRNDTLFLADGPLEMTAPAPGQYRVSVKDFAGCPLFSNTEDVRFQTPPPLIEKMEFSYCLLTRETPEEYEGPIARAQGQDLRWYYDPELGKVFHTGPTYEIAFEDFRNSARLFVTQTVNGEESPPAAIFTRFVLPLELTIDSLGSGLLQAIVNGEDKAVLPGDYRFQWYLNDLPIDEADGDSFQPEGEGGWYTVDILNLTESCLSLDSILLKFPTDTGEVPSGEEVVVFPNPSSDLFYVQFEKPGEKNVWLYDGAGRLLRRFQTHGQILEVNGAGLPAGMYFLRCRTERGWEAVRKVVRR